jgi:hypothetical protein
MPRVQVDSRQPTADRNRHSRAVLLPPAYSLQPTACRPRRPGISLLEVLISMFVLLFGLLGVASIFPVGNYYAGRGDQYDRGAALSEAAFAELESRGLLQPGAWIYAADPPRVEAIVPSSATPPYPPNNPVFIQDQNGTAPGFFNLIDPDILPGRAFVIDPLGASQGIADADVFPYVAFDGSSPGPVPNTGMPSAWEASQGGPFGEIRWPIRRLTLKTSDSTGSGFAFIASPQAVAETVFNLQDDLVTELPKENDRPGIQRWRTDTLGTEDQSDDTLLARAYSGNYSWLATVVPANNDALPALQPSHPMYGSAMYEVAVAVFYKRVIDPAANSERTIRATLNPGGDLVLDSSDLTALELAIEDIRAGQWIALAGYHPNAGHMLLKWYRLLSIDSEDDVAATGQCRATLDGPDWPLRRDASGIEQSSTDIQAILLPGVIGVTTRTVPMQME